MTAPALRWLTVLAALSLLLGGCTMGRSQPGKPTPEQAKAATLSGDVDTLRKENAQLRDQQEAMISRLEALQRTLSQNQAEQRRYREAMTRNFDLLEQSVALTLSKTTVTADLGAPADKSAAAPAASAGPAKAPAAAAAMAPGDKSVEAAPAMRTPPPSTATEVAAPGALALTPVALQQPAETPEPAVEDPDLLPPQSPRHLTAHQEAKPLYEKGFALFARKDYEQSIVVFQSFLQRFPDDIYSDNAQFWIAEANLNLKHLRKAETGYRAVLRNYEHRSTLEGFKTPDAIYRLGQIQQRAGDTRHARHYYQVLAERFPETSAGRKAQRELATLTINTAAR